MLLIRVLDSFPMDECSLDQFSNGRIIGKKFLLDQFDWTNFPRIIFNDTMMKEQNVSVYIQ